MKHVKIRLTAFFLTLSLLLSACGCGKAAAATMYLVKTDGTVHVNDAKGTSVDALEHPGLYSGYSVASGSGSFGWISLDDTKLAKLDEESEVSVLKEDGMLELSVRSGRLFFDVTEPLASDETMEIRTSSMVAGIRGTCGWVHVTDENHMNVWLLRGKVECMIPGADGSILASKTITAGQSARMALDGGTASVTVEEFSSGDIPAFVMDEISDDAELMNAIEAEPDTETISEGADTETISEAVSADIQEKCDRALRAMATLCVQTGQGGDPRELIYDLPEIDAFIDTLIPVTVPMAHLNAGGSLDTLTDSFSYAYHDLDQNGIDELLISHNGELFLILMVRTDTDNMLGFFHLSGIGNGQTCTVCADGSIVRCEPAASGNGVSVFQNRISPENPNQTECIVEEYDSSVERHDELIAASGGAVTDFDWHPLRDHADVEALPPAGEGQADAAAAGDLLTPYAGTYTPYELYSTYGASGKNPVTLQESGTVTGGETDGRSPSSVTQNADGSISILFGTDERYTVYPPGVPTPSYWSAAGIDSTAVNIEYLYTGGGAMNIVYHADPASLGTSD